MMHRAKIVCDNLESLATETALREASLPPTRRINRAAAHSILKPLNRRCCSAPTSPRAFSTHYN